MSETSIPATQIPEAELWVMRWGGYFLIAFCEESRLYTSDGDEVARDDEEDVVALHPYWPPDHDHGTLDQMPDTEPVWAFPMDMSKGAEMILKSQVASPHGWLVIARPHYNPRVAIAQENNDE